MGKENIAKRKLWRTEYWRILINKTFIFPLVPGLKELNVGQKYCVKMGNLPTTRKEKNVLIEPQNIQYFPTATSFRNAPPHLLISMICNLFTSPVQILLQFQKFQITETLIHLVCNILYLTKYVNCYVSYAKLYLIKYSIKILLTFSPVSLLSFLLVEQAFTCSYLEMWDFNQAKTTVDEMLLQAFWSI
jgi:hypothetical protein